MQAFSCKVTLAFFFHHYHATENRWDLGFLLPSLSRNRKQVWPWLSSSITITQQKTGVTLAFYSITITQQKTGVTLAFFFHHYHATENRCDLGSLLPSLSRNRKQVRPWLSSSITITQQKTGVTLAFFFHHYHATENRCDLGFLLPSLSRNRKQVWPWLSSSITITQQKTGVTLAFFFHHYHATEKVITGPDLSWSQWSVTKCVGHDHNRISVSLTLKRLGHFFQNVILFSNVVQQKCNIFIWKCSNKLIV